MGDAKEQTVLNTASNTADLIFNQEDNLFDSTVNEQTNLFTNVENIQSNLFNAIVASESNVISTAKNESNKILGKVTDLENLVKPTGEIKLFSYANALPTFYEEQADNDITKVLKFYELKKLVTPGTDEVVNNQFISIVGQVFDGSYFHETYSIVLEDGSKLEFAGTYPDQATGTDTADGVVEFSVNTGIGQFEGAKKVSVEYTSNQYKSKFITVHY